MSIKQSAIEDNMVYLGEKYGKKYYDLQKKLRVLDEKLKKIEKFREKGALGKIKYLKDFNKIGIRKDIIKHKMFNCHLDKQIEELEKNVKTS